MKVEFANTEDLVGELDEIDFVIRQWPVELAEGRLLKSLKDRLAQMRGELHRRRHDQNIGSRLKQLRTEAGKSLKQVSRKTGVSLGYIHQIESGRNIPSLDILEKLCVGYGIKLSDLFLAIGK
jgi:DNA-binding XRE family transcriptional regulator